MQRLSQEKRQCTLRRNTSYTNLISPKKYSLSSIIRSYKSAVSKKSRSIDPYFSWQPRFYERVIRTEQELFKISEYIIANPTNWLMDDYYH